MEINSCFLETMIRRKHGGQKVADWLFVSCFLYLLLSVACDYTSTTASDGVFFINQHNNNASLNLTLNKCNSSSIECKLENGANCSLSWSYDEQENYLDFVLEFDTPREATWIAIGFNKIKKMIGTSVIMIKIEENSFEIFNGYLKYYNRPLIENYFIRNASKSNANGKTVIKFSRNVSLPTIGHVSLSQCNYLVVASGPIQNRVISNHLNVPKFTEECYNLVVNCSNLTDPTSHVTSTKPNADLKVKKIILDSLRSNHAKHVVKSLSFNLNDLLHKRRSTTLATTTTMTERTTNSSEWDIDSDITIDLILGAPLRDEFASSLSLSTSTSTLSTTTNEPDVSTTIEIPTSRPEQQTTVMDTSLSTSAELTTGYVEEKTQSTTDLISTTTTLFTTTTTLELISTTYILTTSSTSNYSTINLTYMSNETEHTTTLMTSSYSALTSSNTTFASSTFNLSSVSFNPTIKQEHQQSGLKDASQLTLESFIIVAVLNQSFDDTLNDPTSPGFKSLNENVQNYLKVALEMNALMGYNDSKVTNVSPTKDNLQRITAILLYLNDESLVPQAEMRNTIQKTLENSIPDGFPLKIESVSISYTTSESSSKAARKNVEVIFILSSVLGTIALLLIIAFFLMIYYLYRKKMSYNLNNSRRLDKIKLANLIRI